MTWKSSCLNHWNRKLALQEVPVSPHPQSKQFVIRGKYWALCTATYVMKKRQGDAQEKQLVWLNTYVIKKDKGAQERSNICFSTFAARSNFVLILVSMRLQYDLQSYISGATDSWSPSDWLENTHELLPCVRWWYKPKRFQNMSRQS